MRPRLLQRCITAAPARRPLSIFNFIGALAVLILVALFGRAAAEEDPLQARLDLSEQYLRLHERIADTLDPPQWLADSDRFIYWSVREPHRGTWVLVDAQRRTVEPLLAPAELRAQLMPLLGKEFQVPRNLQFVLAPDRQGIVFQLQDQTLALGFGDRRIVPLARTALAALMLTEGSVLSPDRQALALPRGTGFAVIGKDGRTVLERSGEENYGWQVPDRAWSPSGRFLMVWRSDERGVHKIPIVDYTTARERVTLVPYSKTGTPLARPELYCVEPASGRVLRMPPAEAETYDWLAGWRPDGSEALVLRLSRDGKRLDLWAVEPESGRTRLLLREERRESFVGALDFATEQWAHQVTVLADNRHFLWMSERDGWRHVYLADYTGKIERQVTRGTFPVHRVVGVAPKGGAIFVLASAESAAPYDQLLYRADLGGGGLTRLSPEPGIHRITLAPSGRYFVDAHSTRVQPRAWDLASMDGKTPWRYAEADVRGLTELRYSPPEPIQVRAADGVTPLYGVLYKPRDFDPRKRYAVIDCIYAGPFITVVPWSFVGTATGLMANSLAQMGFVVMVLDARGTPGRSKAFQDANYGRVGQIEIPDHAVALRQAAATRPYMDLGRVGIYGHSWGGYFALRGMLTEPALFRAGYAGAPGALEEEAVINEPNLGLPSENAAGYKAGSNVEQAGNLRGALKLMHGTSDVNASLSTTMRMAAALIRAGKRFDLLIMPGEPHGPRGAAGRYYRDDVRRFFVRELGAAQ